MEWKDIPRILRHCVVAVHGKQGGAGPAGVVSAVKICRSCLEKNGYLYHANYEDAALNDIHLTAKGQKRNNEHLREGAPGERKDLAFKRLFEQIEPIIFELDGRGKKPPVAPNPVERQDSERSDNDYYHSYKLDHGKDK